MSPRRLLLHVFSTFAVGGPQVRFCAMANRFGPDLGHVDWRHDIVAMDGNTACRERLHPDVPAAFPAIDRRKGDTLGNVRRFRRALRALRPDVLVTYNWGAIEWAMANAFAGVPHVHVEDGFGPEERARQIPRRVLLRRLLLRRAKVVLPSLTLLRVATETWRLDPRRLRHIPNGIDLTSFAPAARTPFPPNESVHDDGAPNDGPVIGTVAALRPEKNLGRLLRAFALVPHGTARLVVVGDGPERAALEALARTLGVAGRVRFAGHMADPRRAYRGFDLFAMSSDTEQMPLAVLEAMASGLPVAATNVGDIAAMLAEANRPYVTPLEDTALAAALAGLLDRPTLRRELGEANRDRVGREYDQAAMLRAYAGLFAASG